MSEDMPKKLIGGGVALVLIAIGVYYMISAQSVSNDSSLLISSSTSGANTAASGQVDTGRIIQQLNQLQAIDMDVSIFDTPTFLSLLDSTVGLRSQPIGRENPFVPPTYVQQGSPIIPNTNPVSQRPLGQSSGPATSPSEAGSSESNQSTDDAATQESGSGTSTQSATGN